MDNLVPPAPPGFGKPGSVTARVLYALPKPMQREGLMLLFEMGATPAEVRDCSGFSFREIETLLDSSPLPFWRHENSPTLPGEDE